MEHCEDDEAEEGHEVRVMASLLGSSAAPPMPTLSGWSAPCGLAFEAASAQLSAAVGALDLQYSSLLPDEVESLVQIWLRQPQGLGCLDESDDGDDPGDDFRQCAADMILSPTERDTFVSLMSEAPDRSEMMQAANLFCRRSTAHRSEV